jgi:hypothetical protein
MKGLGTFAIGSGIAIVLAALTIWLYDSSQVAVAEKMDAPGVRLHESDG